MSDRRVPVARNALRAILLLALAAPAQMPRVLTLEEAVRVARERQPQIRQARFQVEAAAARAGQARSGLLPQVSASAAYQRTTANFVARPGSVPGDTTTSTGRRSLNFFNFFSGSIAVNQLIWDFGQTYDRYKAAQTLTEAQQNNERAVLMQIDNTVRSAFFLARANRALVGVASATVANFGKHLTQIQGFVEAGTSPEIDLAQGRADLANARSQLIDAQNNYLIAKAQLNQAMGIVASTDYDVSDDALLPVPGEDAAIDTLAEGRYETGVGNAIELGDAQVALTSAEAQTVQADDRLSTARAQLLRALGRQ